jgi:hypothetical protein
MHHGGCRNARDFHRMVVSGGSETRGGSATAFSGALSVVGCRFPDGRATDLRGRRRDFHRAPIRPRQP